MRNSNLNYTIVGLFVLAMLGAVVASAVMLSGRGGSHDRYTVLFDNVADVKYGTQVRYEGFPVGQVESIRPVAENGATRFLLDVSVREGWEIPSDSIARVGKSTFLGAKTVDISRGKSASALKPGARIVSAAPADMFAGMSNIAGQFGDLSRNGLRPLVDRIAGLVSSADRLLETDLTEFLRSLNGLTRDLQAQVPQIATELNGFTRRLNSTMGSVQSVLSHDNIESAGHVIKNVERMSQEFVQISVNLQGTLDRVNGVVVDLGRVIDANKGKVGDALDDTRYVLRSMARNIDAINHNLAGTARNMNEFSRLIRQNPGLLLGGSPPEEVKAEKTGARPSLSQRDSR